MKHKKTKLTFLIVAIVAVVLGIFSKLQETGKIDRNEVSHAVNLIEEAITTYNMNEDEVRDLPSTEIVAQSTEDEEKVGAEQATTENENFEEQGEIAYNGTSEFPKVELGNYTGQTYYSQIDWRWKTHLYTSTGNESQTIGSSGCGPTSAAMVVTAIKGTITPDKMGDLFVKYGYRSANNGTYLSAFRFTADTFNIGYSETYNFDEAMNLLMNNNYVVVSCGNGLFTTGGHFIVLTAIADDTIQVYDPYLYAGKFETSTRRGKAAVKDNVVYVSKENFRKYANYKKFFAFKKETTETKVNNAKYVTINAYVRYVSAQSGLNVRIGAGTNYRRIRTLSYNSMVLVYETNGNWSRIGDNQWVCSDYLTQKSITAQGRGYRGINYVRGLYKVNTYSGLNVRSGPGTNYKRKKLYKNGTRFDTYEIHGEWARTPSGWVNLKYCKLVYKY